MKIVAVDNFNTGLISDVLIAENVSENYAERIARVLNDQESIHSAYFYRAVSDDYVLYDSAELRGI